jgi:hypothetical protein
MSQPYSKRFLVVAATSVSPAPATVPQGKVWIITDMTAYWDSGTNPSIVIQAPGPTVIWNPGTGPFAGTVAGRWNGRVVLYAGETVKATIFAGTWDLTVCGYELDA